MRKYKILIVEDEFLIAFDLKHNLERSSFVVCGTAAEGEESIEMAKSSDPDVILMDINLMGDMDGIDAAKKIGEFSSALIIFTTGYQDPKLRERAAKLKPAAYLIKPISIQEIEKIIRTDLPPGENQN
jgi:YesN/AraC family two-component response regulator